MEAREIAIISSFGILITGKAFCESVSVTSQGKTDFPSSMAVKAQWREHKSTELKRSSPHFVPTAGINV